MRQEKADSTKRESEPPDSGMDSSAARTEDADVSQEGGLKGWLTVLWYILTNPLLRLRVARLRVQIARLRRRSDWQDEQLRRQGIDPDTIPGIPELDRRLAELDREEEEGKEEQRRRKAELWERSKRETDARLKHTWPRWFR